MKRPADSSVPLSYLYAEYVDKCAATDVAPVTITQWAADPSHSPTFRARADVQAIATYGQEGTP